ncbi:MAG: ribonuclease HII [Flavobacteriaceae bacterium]|nr:ribonuclease HII [Flavobacteriaceae bacterium]
MVDSLLVAGFDEAGLGPIIGPLIVSGVIVNFKDLNTLRGIGVDDSKKFGSTHKGRKIRKQIYDESLALLEYYRYKVITAKDIDNSFYNGVNMYELEIKAISEIIKSSELFEDKVDIVYLHQIGTLKKDKLFVKLKRHGTGEHVLKKVIYEKHADKKYVPVSMASIIAKVTRDNILEKISKKICGEYVSGYPTTKTKSFLEKYLSSEEEKLSDYVRFTRDWEPLNSLKKDLKPH